MPQALLRPVSIQLDSSLGLWSQGVALRGVTVASRTRHPSRASGAEADLAVLQPDPDAGAATAWDDLDRRRNGRA